MHNHKTHAHYLRRWFVQKYRLPPTDVLFTGQTEAELTIEMLEDLAQQRDELRSQLERTQAEGTRESSNQRMRLREAIASLNQALGEPDDDEDDLVKQWEEDLEAGRMPDLKRATR